MNSDDYSLNDQDRHDLVLLASGDADDDTVQRANLLVERDRHAALYLAEMRSLMNHLETSLSKLSPATSPAMMSEYETKVIATKIRLRMQRRTLPRRWAIAAAIALVLLPAWGVVWRLRANRTIATARIYPAGGTLGLPGRSRAIRLRPGQLLSTENEIAVVTLPAGTTIILAPGAALHIEGASAVLQNGGLFVRSKDYHINLTGTDAHVAGEAVLNSETGQNSFVQVLTGQVTIGREPTAIVLEGQSAHIAPFRLSSTLFPRPWWLARGLELLQEQK